MSNNILNDIENAIYDTDIKYRETYPGEPKIVIKLSPEGHVRCREEKMASCFFSVHISDSDPAKHFAGYPYEIVVGQVELFKVMAEGL